jgi:hypothetical protein
MMRRFSATIRNKAPISNQIKKGVPLAKLYSFSFFCENLENLFHILADKTIDPDEFFESLSNSDQENLFNLLETNSNTLLKLLKDFGGKYPNKATEVTYDFYISFNPTQVRFFFLSSLD